MDEFLEGTGRVPVKKGEELGKEREKEEKPYGSGDPLRYASAAAHGASPQSAAAEPGSAAPQLNKGKKKDNMVETPAVIHMEPPAAAAPAADVYDRDADLDILLPSDIRSSAGRSRRPHHKTETPDEKRERRAMMEENFEILEGEDRFYEGVASEEKVQQHRERVLEEEAASLRPGDADISLDHQIPSAAQEQPPSANSGEKFFILVRSKTGIFTFSPLPPVALATPTVPPIRVLENLDAPDAFLQHWALLHSQGFQVVSGEGECVILKVLADGAEERQEKVLAELTRRGGSPPTIELPGPTPTPVAPKSADAPAEPVSVPAEEMEAGEDRVIDAIEVAASPAIRLSAPEPTPVPPKIADAVAAVAATVTPTSAPAEAAVPQSPSPAEEAARENWEKKRRLLFSEPSTNPEPPPVPTREALLAERQERIARAGIEKERKKAEAKKAADAASGKKTGRMGRIFWMGIWVAGATGAIRTLFDNL